MGGAKLPHYRYRTPVLTGRWRDSREAALRDAIAAHQALADEAAFGGIRWLVPGDIEEGDGATALKARVGRH